MLAALTTRGLEAPMTIAGPTDGDIFLAYLQQVLCPRLRPGRVVVLDNLCIAKILSGSEINSLHTFLSRSICYDWCSCSATSSYGLACLPAACNRIEACSWKISPSGNSWPC